MWEFVDHVVYINLDKRTDRNARMKQFFKDGQIPDEKVSRFSAIRDTPGILGCMRSHIGALSLAIQNKWKNVLILEDDVAWNHFEKNYKELEQIVNIPNWDVCMLGGLFAETNENRIRSAIYAHAYIVNHHYYTKLLAHFQEGLRLKRSHAGATEVFHNDVYWIKLQINDTWIGVLGSLCIQTVGFSDTHNRSLINGIGDSEGVLFAKRCRQMFQSGVIIGVMPKTFSLFGFKQLPR
jgi:glycosyl transferase family 25